MKRDRIFKSISYLLALLLLLSALMMPSFSEELAEGKETLSAESLEDAVLKKEALVKELSTESQIFKHIDKASFEAAGHVERLPEEEELNSYVFKNADGSKTAYFLDEDVKYVNSAGEVVEKNVALVALDSGFTTRSSNISLALPNDLARGITLAHGSATVSLTPVKAGLTESASVATASLFEALDQALVSAPTGISLGRADYAGAFGLGTTLRYTPPLSGVKEDVILDRYRGQNSFSFTLQTGTLSVYNEDGRYFIAESAEAEEKIFIGETYVYDSGDHFEKGTLSVTQKAEGLYTLTIGASVEFLTDPETVYPVYIDPSLTVSYGENGDGYIEDVTVYSEKSTINYGGANMCFVGYRSSYGTARTAMRLSGLADSFIYDVLHYAFVDSAILTLHGYSGASEEVEANLYPLMTSNWTESDATWNSIGGKIAPQALATGTLVTNGTMNFDLTAFVKEWKIDNANFPATLSNGFMMVAETETLQKRFYSSEVSSVNYKPVFTITYHEGVEISHPEQPYRVVEENEIVYVKQGETVDFSAATSGAARIALLERSIPPRAPLPPPPAAP